MIYTTNKKNWRYEWCPVCWRLINQSVSSVFYFSATFISFLEADLIFWRRWDLGSVPGRRCPVELGVIIAGKINGVLVDAPCRKNLTDFTAYHDCTTVPQEIYCLFPTFPKQKVMRTGDVWHHAQQSSISLKNSRHARSHKRLCLTVPENDLSLLISSFLYMTEIKTFTFPRGLVSSFVCLDEIAFQRAAGVTSRSELTWWSLATGRVLSMWPSCRWGCGWWSWWAAWSCGCCCPSPLSWSSAGFCVHRGNSERSPAGDDRWRSYRSTGYSSCSDWPTAQTESRRYSLSLHTVTNTYFIKQ